MAASIIDLGTALGRLQALLREFRADTEGARSGTGERIFTSKEALTSTKAGLLASHNLVLGSYRLIDVVNRSIGSNRIR
jgi:hypothetical protein